jgi:hypothetical protein
MPTKITVYRRGEPSNIVAEEPIDAVITEVNHALKNEIKFVAVTVDGKMRSILADQVGEMVEQ